MVISIGFGRCGCRVLTDPFLETKKIFIDLDSHSLGKTNGTYHVKDEIVSSWFDVTVESEISHSLIEAATQSIRRYSETLDRSDMIQFFASPSGSSGGGLLSLIVESLADESYDLRLASLVFPHSKMVRRGNAINTVMTLATLCDSVKSFFCFDNSTLLRSDFSTVNEVVAGCSESFSRFPEHIPMKWSMGNFFVKKNAGENLLLQMESVVGRGRPELLDRPAAVFSGSPHSPGSLVNSVDSIFGKNSTKKPAIQLEIEPSLAGLGTLAIAYREKGKLENIIRPIISRVGEETSLVPAHHCEWFLENFEKLKLEFS